MIEETKSSHTPLRCVLATDARFNLPDLVNDQIWEFSTSENEPPSLMLHTTFGLRAYWMKIFPAFILDGVTVTDPKAFSQQPILEARFPAYVSLRFSPFPDIDARIEIWVPSSQAVTARIHIQNTSSRLQNFRMLWNVQLNPISNGQRMTAQQFGLNTVLQGHSQNLSPVFYITGGPEPLQTPYPSLAINMMMEPGRSRTITWALASLRSVEESFNLARQITGRNWDSELLKMEMAENRECFNVSNPNKHWDAVLAHSQTRAFQLLMGNSTRLPGTFILQSRNPDHGFSLRGDGSDFGPDWAGFTSMQTWYMSKFLLPGNPNRLREILQNFWDCQKENGFIPGIVSTSRQHGTDLAAPILAEIVWKLHQVQLDEEYLRQVYPSLLRFFKFWVSSSTTETTHEVPTWQNPAQGMLDSIKHFDPVEVASHISALPSMISPGLLSLLYRDCQNLIRMAEQLQEVSDIEWLNQESRQLVDVLETCWNGKTSSYRWLDLETKGEIKKQSLCTYKKNGEFHPNKSIHTPSRITVCIERGAPAYSTIQIKLHGQTAEGKADETISPRQVQWQLHYGRIMTSRSYTVLESVEIEGLHPGDQVHFIIPGTDFEEISLLLPLWAGIPSPERARQIIERTINGRYLSGCGLTNIPRGKGASDFPPDSEVSIFWNSFILEGLINYSAYDLAAKVYSAELEQESKYLSSSQGLYPLVQLDTMKGVGDRDTLTSLFPISDLVTLLGVKLWTDHEMLVENLNTFLPTFTVKYYRTKVEFLAQETIIQSIHGDSQSITDPLPRRILFP